MDIQFREMHPLENSLVLNLIFERCRLKDLKNCRLVSRLWLDASRLAWRSAAVAKLDTRESGRQLSDFRFFSKSYAPRMEPSRKEMPFTNYHLIGIGDCRWFYSFWSLSIKILKLESVRFEDGNIFLKTVFNCCENLEDLDIHHVTVAEPLEVETGESHNAGWKKLIKKRIDWKCIKESKKLKSLSIYRFSWEGVTWMEFFNRLLSLQGLTLMTPVSKCNQLLQSIKLIRQNNPANLNLKLFDHRERDDFPPDLVPVLLDSRLHLKDLYLGSLTLSKLGNALSDILNNHASSLREIRLRNGPGPHDAPIHFSGQVQFINLRELFITSVSGHSFPLMRFLRHSPNLRKITFWNNPAQYIGIEEDKDLLTTGDIKLKHCSELVLLVPGLSVQNLKQLIRWMPNLKKLRIGGINNEIFLVICGGWSNLVRLDVEQSTVDDSGITGLDVKDVKRINKNGRRSNWRPVTVPRASVSSLKCKLQTFGLTVKSWKSDLGLGYSAIACGFQLMPNLKQLNIDLSNYKGGDRVLWKNVLERYPWSEDEN